MIKYFLLLLFFPIGFLYAQESDDLYFSSSDREKLQKKEKESKPKTEKKKEIALVSDPSLRSLTWTLSCKGLTTQYQKSFSGNSRNFSEAARLLTDSLKNFYKTEKISVHFTFDSTTAELTDTIDWKGLKEFFYTKFLSISNCEKMNFSYPEWLTPLIVDKGTLFTIDKSLSAPEGEASLKLSGKKTGNICSFSKYFKNEYSNNYATVKSPLSSADQTWIFFYAYGTGDSTDMLQLMVYQTIYRKGVTVTILQKAYSCKIPLDFKGWKPIAIRYSDLQLPEGMEENTKRLPQHLSTIEFSLIGGTDGEASVNLDQIMILANK